MAGGGSSGGWWLQWCLRWWFVDRIKGNKGVSLRLNLIVVEIPPKVSEFVHENCVEQARNCAWGPSICIWTEMWEGRKFLTSWFERGEQENKADIFIFFLK